MVLTQMQIIQSLGETMAWFEREIGWGIPPKELPHLIDRIGTLYAALITNGQMATEAFQIGYDIVSMLGEKVAVKTVALPSDTNLVSFLPNALEQIDRIIILGINTEEMQIEILMNKTKKDALAMLGNLNAVGKVSFNLSTLIKKPDDTSAIPVKRSAVFEEWTLQELVTGAVKVLKSGEPLEPAKPEFRRIAASMGLSIYNGNGAPLDTRRLGSMLIREINAKELPNG